MEHVRTRWVTLRGGLRLRLAESGERTDPPVLLLHGWGASLYMWRDWFAPLAAAGRRAIAVDLPGHGLSAKPLALGQYRLDALTSVVRELMEVEGLADVDVVAQSMSGTISLEVALEETSRVRRLVLVNPACFGRLRWERFVPLFALSAADRFIPHLVTRWMVARTHRMVYGDPSRVTPRDVEEAWAPSQFPSFARATRQLVHEFTWTRPSAAEMAARLRALRSEVLVVLGARDRLILDARPYVAELIASGVRLRMREIEGGGHAVNEERPDEVAPLAIAFIAR